MSAAEVIAMIEKLPPEEQQQVREFLEQRFGDSGENGVRRMTLPKAQSTGNAVFERHGELFRRLSQ